MTRLPREMPEHELESMPSRRLVLFEDAMVLLCLATLWLPITGVRGAWVTAVLGVSLVLMIGLLIRRKQRVDRLFEELRRKQRELEQMGGYPTLPGMIPPSRLPSEPPASQSAGDGGRRSS